jgi:energy-coupling factor transporter ATP-binding protein EcfA2
MRARPRRRLRCSPRSRGRQARAQLYAAALRALRRSDRRREHPLLRRPLRSEEGRAQARSEQLLKPRDERVPQALAGKLSGGMKQKLGLVCALIHRPKVILLDEPTTGVDPVSRRDFWRILYELIAEGVAILTSTAYLDEAERCHRVALLHQGKLLFCDTPANLKTGLEGRLVVTSPSRAAARRTRKDAEGISACADRRRRARGGGRCGAPHSRIRGAAQEPAFPSMRFNRLRPPSKTSLSMRSRRSNSPCLSHANSVVDREPRQALRRALWPSTISISRSAKARSLAFSGPTAPANPPPFACCAVCSSPPPAARWLRVTT